MVLNQGRKTLKKKNNFQKNEKELVNAKMKINNKQMVIFLMINNKRTSTPLSYSIVSKLISHTHYYF